MIEKTSAHDLEVGDVVLIPTRDKNFNDETTVFFRYQVTGVEDGMVFGHPLLQEPITSVDNAEPMYRQVRENSDGL